MSSHGRLIELLEESGSEYYTETLDVIPGMVIIKDDLDDIVWVNKSVLQNTGTADRNTLVGKKTHTILDFMPKDKYHKLDIEILKHGISILNTVDIIDTPTIKQMTVRVDKVPFIDPLTNNCIGVVTYILNISDTLTQILTKYINEVEYASLRCATKKLINSLITSTE